MCRPAPEKTNVYRLFMKHGVELNNIKDIDIFDHFDRYHARAFRPLITFFTLMYSQNQNV